MRAQDSPLCPNPKLFRLRKRILCVWCFQMEDSGDFVKSLPVFGVMIILAGVWGFFMMRGFIITQNDLSPLITSVIFIVGSSLFISYVIRTEGHSASDSRPLAPQNPQVTPHQLCPNCTAIIPSEATKCLICGNSLPLPRSQAI